MSNTIEIERSQSTIDLWHDLATASDRGFIASSNGLDVRVSCGRKNVWFVMAIGGVRLVALRAGMNSGTIANFQSWSKPDGSFGAEWTSELGAMRARLAFAERRTLVCTTSFMPSADLTLSEVPRDVLVIADGSDGRIHTHQRGLRSGIVFAGSQGAQPFSMLYLQDFSALSDFFSDTKQTPADSVGGTWPLLGYALPAKDRHLAAGREWTISAARVTIADESPAAEDALSGLYLDLLAETYLTIERPAVRFHRWDERAAAALRDLSLSPACTYERQGRRFLMPYVGDETKPPESMVQFTLAVNVGEYDRWRNERSSFGAMLAATAPAFFNAEIGSIVRWLPGETFDAKQADDNMSHEAMDSWYLHHSLFNVARLAVEGDAEADSLFRNSLPFLIRVARRFNYRWPIFFNLKTLDIIRAEAAPGAGGETDVAGIYALVMLHAHEMYGDAQYLQEAEVALAALHGFGFNLAYQLNTTGFGVEAAIRLYKITGKRRYLGLADVGLANIFDNMWLWQCGYGHARHYPTFFGLFPLRDAPYIAPYEELEAHAKFQELLALGGEDLRPSVRLLVAEFQKYSMDRCWSYYPDALPVDAVSKKPRNGRIERSLAVPLEDLQDGMEESGQVGQELYGAGLPFVMAARHFMSFAGGALIAHANYPMYDFTEDRDGTVRWRAGGDARGDAELRIIPRGLETPAYQISIQMRDGGASMPVRGSVSPEGHALYRIRGGQTIEIAYGPAARLDESTLTIGAAGLRRPA